MSGATAQREPRRPQRAKRFATWAAVIACIAAAFWAGAFEHGYSASHAACPNAVALADEGLADWHELVVALADTRSAQNANNDASAQVAQGSRRNSGAQA